MNLNDRKSELASLIDLFLKNKKSIQALQAYAWHVIDEFSDSEIAKSSKCEIGENVFWYAIWQVQHLASEDHLRDATLKRSSR